MNQFTLKQVEYFCAVAEAGSFSAAAENLYLSQSAVATGVTDLERSLGSQLLIRKKAQGIQLTPAGNHFLHESRDLLRRARELQLSASDQSDRLRGPVTIGCYSTLAATVLPRLISGFSALHPEVDVSFIDGAMPTLEPLLKNGLIDVLITYRISLPPGLAEATLYETETYVLLHAGHRLAHEDVVSLADLVDEPLIMLDHPPSGRHTLDMLHAAGIHPRVAHRTGNFELVRSMVGRGSGYSLLVQRPEMEYSYEGLPLVTKRISPQFSRETVVIVWPEEVALTARAQALVEYAMETVHAGERGDTPTARS